MSDPIAPGGGDFLRNMLGDLLRLIPTGGPLQWELAYQLAMSVAAGDEADPNPDPMVRIRLEELSAIAELHVADVTGMVLGSGGAKLRLVPITRVEWARRSLDAWRPLLDRLAGALSGLPDTTQGRGGAKGTFGGKAHGGSTSNAASVNKEPLEPSMPQAEDAPGEMPADPFLEDQISPRDIPPADENKDKDVELVEMIGRWSSAIAPAMAAMQIGSVVGHMARRCLGQYDLPLPRIASSDIFVVADNLDRVATEWSLPIEDLRLWLCAHEMTFHAVLSRSHVRKRLEDLVVDHVKLVRPDPRDLQGLLQGMDIDAIPGLSQMMGDQSLSGEPDLSPSPALERVRAELSALTAAIAGYVDYVTSQIASRLIGGDAPIGEAMRRRRVSRDEGERVAESLFGLHLDQEVIDRGAAFVHGVLDRSGESDLGRLWTDEKHLPTPAEVDAPGLWLARINLETRDS